MPDDEAMGDIARHLRRRDDAAATVIDTFRDMSDRPVTVDVYLGMIRLNGGTVRINAAEDVDRLIKALERARDHARRGGAVNGTDAD